MARRSSGREIPNAGKTEQLRFTAVWMKQQGRWQEVVPREYHPTAVAEHSRGATEVNCRINPPSVPQRRRESRASSQAKWGTGLFAELTDCGRPLLDIRERRRTRSVGGRAPGGGDTDNLRKDAAGNGFLKSFRRSGRVFSAGMAGPWRFVFSPTGIASRVRQVAFSLTSVQHCVPGAY